MCGAPENQGVFESRETNGNQTTQYLNGSTQSDSDVARSDLKVAEVYPDSVDGDDRITFKHNRQGQVKETRDQNGSFDFDGLGRPVQDRVATLGTDVDGAGRSGHTDPRTETSLSESARS